MWGENCKRASGSVTRPGDVHFRNELRALVRKARYIPGENEGPDSDVLGTGASSQGTGAGGVRPVAGVTLSNSFSVLADPSSDLPSPPSGDATDTDMPNSCTLNVADKEAIARLGAIFVASRHSDVGALHGPWEAGSIGQHELKEFCACPVQVQNLVIADILKPNSYMRRVPVADRSKKFSALVKRLSNMDSTLIEAEQNRSSQDPQGSPPPTQNS
jgi:hypothetical protein